jgi:hypothetical protein
MHFIPMDPAGEREAITDKYDKVCALTEASGAIADYCNGRNNKLGLVDKGAYKALQLAIDKAREDFINALPPGKVPDEFIAKLYPVSLRRQLQAHFDGGGITTL